MKRIFVGPLLWVGLSATAFAQEENQAELEGKVDVGGAVVGVNYLGDDRFVTITADGKLQIWDRASQKVLNEKQFPGAMSYWLASTSEGDALAVVDVTGTRTSTLVRTNNSDFQTIDLEISEQTDAYESAFLFFADNRYLAMAGRNQIRIWKTRTGRISMKLGTISRCRALSASEDLSQLTCFGSHLIERFSLYSGEREELIEAPWEYSNQGFASPSGRYFFSQGYVEKQSKFQIYDAQLGRLIFESVAEGRPFLHSGRFLGDDTLMYMVFGSWVKIDLARSSQTHVWNVDDLIEQGPDRFWYGGLPYPTAISPDLRQSITRNGDHSVRVWGL